MNLDVATIGTPKQAAIPPDTFGVIAAGIAYNYNFVAAKTPFAVSIPSASGFASFSAFFWACFYMNPKVWFTGGYDPYQDLVTDAIEQEWDSDPDDGHNTVMGA